LDNERCHVTVVGTRRRVDLAVPAHAPIAEYTPVLLKLCGQEASDDTFPPAWSLALAGARPFAPEASLTSSGVADGAVLYLRDCAAGEFDAPVVTDLDEIIAGVGETGVPWDARHRAGSALVLGLLSLIGSLTAMIVLLSPDPSAGGAAVVLGAVGALLAWQAGRRGWRLLLGPRLALAVSAVPLFAVAADSFLTGRTGPETALAAASAGALVGALLARAAIPHVTTLLAVWLTALALPVTVVLDVLHATLTESAGVVAVVTLAVLRLAPAASGHLSAMAVPSTPGGGIEDGPDGIPWLVGRGKRVLIGINVLCAVVLAACSVVLGLTGDGFAVGLSACLGLALILRTGDLKLLAAMLPPIAAGVVALGMALIHAPAVTGLPTVAGPAVFALLGLIAVGLGVAGSVRPGPESGDATWPGQLAWLFTLLSVLLAVGVFGVFTQLLQYGESL
jgi:type VII secretion integral membrane protein EccD